MSTTATETAFDLKRFVRATENRDAPTQLLVRAHAMGRRCAGRHFTTRHAEPSTHERSRHDH